MGEHMAQVYQHAILGLSIPDSHGILADLNIEWSHLTYNLSYFILLLLVFYFGSFHKFSYFDSKITAGIILFTGGLSIQGYHVIEHSVRIVQFLHGGCIPCPGILGMIFDGVYLHALFNTAVYVLPVASFLLFDYHKKILKLIGYQSSSKTP